MEKTKNKAKENLSQQQAIDRVRNDAFENILPEQDKRQILGKSLELLAKGCPVLPDEIALVLGVPPKKVLSTLLSFGAEFDKDGNVLGLGLTLVPTPHAYEANGRKLYTWCAVDALLFPIMLKHTAHIESHDPVTEEKIHVTVSPDGVQKVEPDSAVVSWVKDIDLSNIRGSVCHYVHFFSSFESASKWIAEHPDKTFYPVNNDVYPAVMQLKSKFTDVQTKSCC
jgi:alkylmercury lyase